MFANRAYSSGLFAPPDRGASLLYFAAAIPAVGFCASGTRGCRRHFLGGPNRRRLATFVGRGREPAACCSSGAGFSFGLKQFPSSDNRACGSGCASPQYLPGDHCRIFARLQHPATDETAGHIGNIADEARPSAVGNAISMCRGLPEKIGIHNPSFLFFGFSSDPLNAVHEPPQISRHEDLVFGSDVGTPVDLDLRVIDILE